MSGFDDFDFMIGDWDIANERLVGRLVGSDTWETFPATSRVEKVMPTPAGTAAIWTRCLCPNAASPA